MISSALKRLFDACVKDMVLGVDTPGINFISHATELRTKKVECLERLARGVAAASRGQLTVREIHRESVEAPQLGASFLYLVVCSQSTPAGLVAQPTADMLAFGITPGYNSGCIRYPLTSRIRVS